MILTDEEIKSIGIACAQSDMDDEDDLAMLFARSIELAVYNKLVERSVAMVKAFGAKQ